MQTINQPASPHTIKIKTRFIQNENPFNALRTKIEFFYDENLDRDVLSHQATCFFAESIGLAKENL